MSKHTEGPWKACRSNEDFDGPYFESEEIKPFTAIQAKTGSIVTCHDLCEIEEADAYLMAAAPELLKALEIANELIKNEYPEEQWPDYNVLVNEAVIAKAKGESL